MHQNLLFFPALPAYMSMEVSSPSLTFRSLALTRVSTARLGEYHTMQTITPSNLFNSIDPTIRVTYHPRIKRATQSGFYNKTFIQSYTQRITVHNAKSSASGIDGDTLKIKIIDQAPISEDSTITVKLVQPTLVLPGADGKATVSTGTGGEARLPAPIKISSGVTASWDGADEVSLGSVGQSEVDIDSLGRDGRLCWICAVQPQAKVNVNLQYEISAPMKTNIQGL